jgi:hypothetical protein
MQDAAEKDLPTSKDTILKKGFPKNISTNVLERKMECALCENIFSPLTQEGKNQRIRVISPFIIRVLLFGKPVR